MKMKLSAFAIFTLMLSLLLGCASRQPAQPDWIAGDSANYKSSQYLIGRGQAATQEEAKDRARADLSKIFQVAVTADSEDVQKFKTSPACRPLPACASRSASWMRPPATISSSPAKTATCS